ncbi:MAG TPA: glycosyltransferase [Jiangellaceae bacterium]|nr:glycosyltransferase [Jiangellaceae bacterium]
MRYLFVTVSAGGNLAPELALAYRLVGRGHQVRFLGHRAQQAAVESAGCGFSAYRAAPDWDSEHPDTTPANDWDGGPFKQFAELRERMLFGPAAAFAADVLDELDRHPADCLAVDSLSFGAMAAAERSGLPTAVLWHFAFLRPTPQTTAPGFGLATGWPGRLRDRALNTVERRLWEKGLPALNAARETIELGPLRSVFEQYDRLARVLVMTSAAFDFATISGIPLPPNVRFVGPQAEVPAYPHRATDATAGPPLVLVSSSTAYQAQLPVLRRVIDALGTLPVRALVTTGPAVEVTDPVPHNVEVQHWVPHAEVLPEASLVVTHAGHGTVMAALAHGVPMVCLPLGREQPDNAARVVHAGAGVRLRPTASARQIAAAVRRVLDDPEMTRGAARMAAAIAAEVKADRAIAELEALTVGGTTRRQKAPDA